MTEKQILSLRLHNQQLVKPQFATAAEVVEWMGAVQAQDYYGALWAVGQRMKTKANESDIEKDIVNKKIVRSWPMRGTLHFVEPNDLRWMLKYLAVKVRPRMNSVFKKAGLDENTFARSKKIFEKVLSKEISMTREELYEALEQEGISTAETRGLHMLGDAANAGLICFGPRRGKQPTMRLLDEWIPSEKPLPPKEEALARLATIYIRSHGPVQIEDLAWWSGLSKTEAKASIDSIQEKLVTEKVKDKVYWFFDNGKTPSLKSQSKVLSTYDEYGMAYKDRSLIITDENMRKAGGFFISAIVHDGKVTGLWRRTIGKDQVVIETKAFKKFTAAQKKQFQAAAKDYAKFLGFDPKIKTS